MKRILILLVAGLVIACGCGKKDESIAKQAGKKVGETLTDFGSGVGKGVDTQMLVNVELSEELTKQGVSKTVSKGLGIDQGGKGITVYFVAKSPFKGKFLAKAMNKEGQEIGRSVADVDFAADDAKYVTFRFDREMDTQLVDKYMVSAKE